MKIEFYNYWIGNSLKHGGCFPFILIEIAAEFNSFGRHFAITVLNFCIVAALKDK